MHICISILVMQEKGVNNVYSLLLIYQEAIKCNFSDM